MTSSGFREPLVPPADWAVAQVGSQGSIGPGFLLVCTLVGAVLRLFALDGQSLWVDEMLTWQMVRPGVPAGFVEQVLDSIQGPLYMAVVWPLVRIQDSALMMRLPSALAGILTIPVFGLLVSRLAGRKTARLSVLLLALNPFHVWYSQEGRGYAFLILFSVLMALAYMELGSKEGGTRKALVFALVSACAAWSNLGGLFLWVAMGLGLLLFHFPRGKRSWMSWGLGFGGGLVLVLPWLLKAAGIWAVDRVLPGGGIGESLRGETTFSLLAWPYTLETFFYGYSFGPSLRELHQPDRLAVLRGSWPLLFAGAVPVGAGVLAGLFSRDRRRWLLVVWIVVPVLIMTFLAVRNVKPWNPRYLAMVLPWVLILAAWGLARLPSRVGLGLTVLLVGLTLWSLGGYYGNGRYAKADVRAAAVYLEQANDQGDPLLVPVVSSVFNYYYGGGGDVLGSDGLAPLKSAVDADAFYESALAGRDRCWLVLAREWYFDPEGILPVSLARHGHLRLVLTEPGVRVYEWKQQEAHGTQP